ncbi:MAG: EAL domain-containing protein [Acidimicrobiales bacterium]
MPHETRTRAAGTLAERQAGARAAAAVMLLVGLAALVLIAAFTEWQVALLVAASVAAGGVATRIHTFLGLRNRFDAVAHVTNEAVVVTGADGACLYASPSVEGVLGITPQAVTEVSLPDRLHASDAAALTAAAAEAQERPGGTYTVTCRFRHADGSWRWIELSGVNLLDDPTVQGLVTTMRDVTDRVDAERAVRSSNDRFHALVANSTDVLVLLDVHGHASFASPTIASNLGLLPDDVLGVGLLDFTHPLDRARADQVFLDVRSTPGAAAELELRALRGDGDYAWMEVRLQNLLDDPAVGGIVLHARDVSARRNAELALEASEQLFRSLATSAPIGIFRLDLEGRIDFANDRFREITGVGDDRVDPIDALAVVHPDDRAALIPQWAEALRSGTEYRGSFRLVGGDGVVHQVVGQTSPLTDESGALVGAVGTVLDVTDLVDARQNASRFQSIIESTSDIVVITDRDGVPQYLNRAARQAMGVSADTEVRSLDASSYFTPMSWRRVLEEAYPSVVADGVWNGELELVHPVEGTVTPVSHVMLASSDPDGGIDFVASISRDMSDQKSLEAQLQHQADHDELTGLPNRKPLIAYLEAALANAHRFGGSVAVLFVDLDHFKVVNDSVGHHAGDQLLRVLAERLAGALRPHDRAGRFGGDEFVAICPGIGGTDELARLADRVRTAVRGSVDLDGDEAFVTVSIGAALGTGVERPSDLLRDADAAMYEAKARGRDRVQLFDGTMRLHLVERLQIERELRRALEEAELVLQFQPVVSLATRRIAGVEVLVRWQHPERGLLLPDQFLPVAEETGLIADIGVVVLDGACRAAATWPIDPSVGEPTPVYVNLSARELSDPHLADRIAATIDAAGIDPAGVHLEITENALLEDAIATKAALLELRRVGVRLALDDFGTGYSSLAYLKHFPVDALKIDKAFVEGLGGSGGDDAITAAIVDVAQRLGLQTVAEGVERAEQAEWLTALGCDLAQGFHFAPPLDAEAVRAALEAQCDGSAPAAIDLTAPPAPTTPAGDAMELGRG